MIKLCKFFILKKIIILLSIFRSLFFSKLTEQTFSINRGLQPFIQSTVFWSSSTGLQPFIHQPLTNFYLFLFLLDSHSLSLSLFTPALSLFFFHFFSFVNPTLTRSLHPCALHQRRFLQSSSDSPLKILHYSDSSNQMSSCIFLFNCACWQLPQLWFEYSWQLANPKFAQELPITQSQQPVSDINSVKIRANFGLPTVLLPQMYTNFRLQ